MPCEILTPTEGAFAGSTVFMCTQPAEPCVFCGAPSVALCDWPVERTRRHEKRADEIAVGDEVHCGGQSLTVVTTERAYSGQGVYLAFKGRLGQPALFLTAQKLGVFVTGSSTCDNPVCDLHRRNLDEERDHCREHWTAWEAVA